MIESYPTTDGLLSVLPLNLLPELSVEKKDKLIENNEIIKEEFGIERLTDWADLSYSAEEVAQFLRDNYFPEDETETWENNVQKIVEKASQVRRAME